MGVGGYPFMGASVVARRLYIDSTISPRFLYAFGLIIRRGLESFLPQQTPRQSLLLVPMPAAATSVLPEGRRRIGRERDER
jgi:hypothetical protein